MFVLGQNCRDQGMGGAGEQGQGGRAFSNLAGFYGPPGIIMVTDGPAVDSQLKLPLMHNGEIATMSITRTMRRILNLGGSSPSQRAKQRVLLRSVRLESLETRCLLAQTAPYSFTTIGNPSVPDAVAPANETYNEGGGDVLVHRSAPGEYRVTFPGLGAAGADGGHVQVTALGEDNRFCQSDGWTVGTDFTAYVNCYTSTGFAVDSRFTLAVMHPYNDARIAYAWSESAGSPGAPAFYSHNPEGDIEVTRTSAGNYSVRFQGLGDAGNPGGTVQVTSYGSDPRRCAVTQWISAADDLTAAVRCTDVTGAATDSIFNIAVVPADAAPNSIGFAWADQPGTGSYSPNELYRHNPGGTITALRTGVGSYGITFNGINPGGAGGHILVTSYGGSGNYCKVNNPSYLAGNILSKINCYNAAGLPTDSQYDVLVTPSPARLQLAPYSFAWVDDISSATSVANPTWSYNEAGPDVQVRRQGVGRFQVLFPDLARSQTTGGHVQVTAYGSDAHCQVVNWGGVSDFDANVRCYDPAGALADSRFTIGVLFPDNRAGLAYAWSDNADAPVAPAHYAHNPAGGVNVNRTRIGQYQVTFTGLGGMGMEGGTGLVTSYGTDGSRCNISGWTSFGADLIVGVSCVNTDGSAANAEFNVAVVPARVHTSTLGFTWNSRETTPNYTPDPVFSHNPSGGGITIQRNATGNYSVEFERINRTLAFGGNVLATAFRGGSGYCNVANWRSGEADMTATVVCYSAAGTPADLQFDLMIAPPPSGEIRGTLYTDVDGDGSRDFGEAPLANREVFVDLNLNGAVDLGEPYEVTDASGGYIFSALPGATHKIEVVQHSCSGVTRNTIVDLFPGRRLVFDMGLDDVVDLNGDGSVDAADAGVMFGNWGNAGIGDINRDGIVDAADAGRMFACWTGDPLPGLAAAPTEPAAAATVFETGSYDWANSDETPTTNDADIAVRTDRGELVRVAPIFPASQSSFARRSQRWQRVRDEAIASFDWESGS